ncbi:autotransporter-associated beta strand repeat-containing protein [Citrobacter freundii]|nr:autotransporter-associated beta strand repeat-containing protein [Citrobacter freundii]
MNKVFKIVWNAGLQCWVVVSEIAKSHGKTKSERRLAKRAGKAAMGVLGGMALLSAANASTLIWSPTGQSSGGSGTWDTSSSAWYNGTITMPWNNAAGDSAWFGAPGGTVTLAGLIRIQDLSFTTDGYILTGGTLDTFSSQSLVNVSSGATATINSLISGSGMLALTGGGKLILTGANTYAGGTAVSGGSVLEVSSDSNLGAAAGVLTLGNPSTMGTLNITGAFNGTRNVTLNLGGGNINVSPGVTATFNGVVSGSGALNLTGTGTTVLNGANTWTGTTTIGSGGTLQVGTGGTTGTLGTGATVNNGVLAFNRSNAYTYGGVISGTGSLQNMGSGTTTLSGANTFTGGVLVSAGKLVLTNANNSVSGSTIASGAALELNGGSSSISGNIANNGALIFSRGTAYTFAGIISGTGTVNQNAGNWITLTGANTYSGGTFIGGNGGIIVNNDNNLGAASGGITFNNGTGYFQAPSAFATSRTITINSGATGFFSSSSGSITLASPIVGAGSFGVNGGTVILTGTNNTYSGTTNINGGTLQINDESNLSSNAAGGITYTGGGFLRVMSSSALTRNIAMNANGNFDAYNGSVVTLNSTVSGGGRLYFYGGGTPGGTVLLTGNNTHTGGIGFWTGSRVVVASDSNMGAATGLLQFNGGTLASTATFASGRAVDLNGAGAFDVASATTLTMNGVVSGAGRLTKANTGTLVLSGANTWTGGTTISGGTLQIGNGGTSGSFGTGNVTNNGTLAFNRSDVNSYNNVISGTGAVVQSGSGSTTLSANNTYTGATTVSAGTLYVNGNQSSATGLTTVSSGATLGGNGTIGGSVTVADGGTLTPGASADAAGTLTIRGNLALSSGAVLNYNLGQAGTVGGSLNDLTVVNGNLTLAGTLNVTTSTGGTFDAGVYRIISYAGSLTNNGMVLGALPAGANATLQTSVAGQVNLINNYAGTTFWDGATGHDNSAIDGGSGIWNTGVGANSNWTDGSGVANGAYSTNFAVFQGTPGTVTVDNSQGQVAVTGMQFMADGYRISGDTIVLNETTSGSGFSTLRVGDGTAAGSSYTATIDAILDGFTGLSKTDLGTLILTGANTYTGGTNISGGTLQLGDGTTNGSVLGNIANAGTLALKPASGTSMAVSGVVSGSGALKMIGTGTAVLTGTNTYTGGTTISSGTLQIGDGTTNGALPGNVVNNAALVFMPKTATTLNYGGVISGTGTVTQNGPGTTVFTGANTYTGGTIISSGVLQLGDGTSNNDGSIAGNVTNNGTLAFRFNGSKTVSNVISGSGNVSQLSGTTTLSGVNTYTGGTTLTGGLLAVSNDNNLGDVSGRLTFDGGILQTTANIARDIVITANGGRVYNTNGSTLSGNISGTGVLEFQSGTTYITGNNTSSGGIILSEYATVVINSANALGTGKITGRSRDNVYGGGGNLRTTATMTLANDIDLGFTSFYGSGSQQSVGFITDAGTTLTLTGNINNVGGYRPQNGFSKNGAGTMVLANARYDNGDSYPVRVYGGTLIVGDGGSRGTIGASSSVVASGAALKFNRGDTYLYSGGISGAGSFEQIGTGTLVLTGNSTHTGGSTITSGTVQLGNGGTTGWISGNITNNGTLAFNRSDNVTWSNLISGTGSLSKLGTNTLTLTGTQAYTGGTTINAGILQLGDGTTDGSIIGNVNMAGGALAFNASNGSMTDQNALISGAGGVTKLGLGTTVLKGANTYTGATTVSAGTLYIDGNQSAATGATTVANGATLGGNGTIGGNVTIANGATLMPGSESGTGGTLTINGNLALNDLSILNYQFGKVNGVAENTRTDVNGNLTLDGRLNVSTPAGGTFSAGVYRVFNYNGTLTNNGLVLGTVPAGTTLALQSTVPGQVNLINSTGQLLAFWDGMNSANYNQGSGEGGTGTWRLLGQTSWADVSGSSNSAYGNRSFAVFGGTAGTVTVDNAFGQVETSGMQFTTTGYVLNGGVIALVNSPVDGSTPELRVGDGSDASRNMTATIDSVLQGATSVTKTDLGTLVLTGNNTWTGGTRVNGGVLQVSSDANLGATSGALSFDGGTLATTTSFNTARTTTLNTGGGTLDTAAGTTLTMSGIIGGTGSLTKTNSGTLLLTGTNTWTGGTAINGGIVQVSADANLGAATGPLSFDGGTLVTTTSFNTARATTLNTGGGTLDTAAGTTLTMSGVVSGSGALTKTNTGTLTLTNSNTWSGGTTISGGTLQLGNGGTGGSLTGNVTNNGTLAFNRSDTSTLAGVISGSGVVNQIGTGKTILSGINTYSGGTTISAGTLVAQNGAALGTGAVVNNAALQLDFAADSTLANVLSGSGALSKTGSGTATLTATGSAQGAVTVSGGTLAFGQSGAFNAASMNVASGGAITVNPNSNIVLSGAYTQAAGATFNGVADTQAKTAVTAATASLNGTLNITGFGIAAPVTASGLTGTQYTVVHTTNGITGNFSSVNLNGAASTVDYLRLAGRVSGNDYNVGYGLSWLEGLAYGTGSFTLAGASDTFNVDVALGNQAAGTYASGWDGKTLTKAGAGSLTLSSVNTYTGDTLVNGGTLKAGIASAFAQSANVAVASGATLDLNNFNQTARNLSGAGNVTLGSAMLTENAVSDTTFSGTLSGTGGLTKTGSGVFTLSGTNTYSGGTTISAGTLVAQNGAALGTGAVVNNAALQLDFAANGTLANVLSGNGTLTKTGNGTTTLTGAGSTQGAVTVSGGTLAFGQNGAFNAASLTTAAGAATQVAATSNLMLSGALTQAAGSTLTVAKGTQPAVTAQTANLNGTLSLSGYGTAAPASASGIAGTQYTVIHTTNGITGDFSSVNLNGAASTVDYLRLAGRVSGNDYNVGYGLSWLEGQAYGTGSFTLANASDAFNVDVALGDQAAGTYTSGWDGKTLTKAGAGTLTLSSVNTYTGDTLVNGGTLKAGIANAFAQSANVAVASGATLDLNNFNQTAHNLSGAGNVTLGSAMLTENAVSDTTFSGTLSGTGGLTKTGSGVFTLSGNNTYSGGTTVSAGTLVAKNGAALGTGAVANNAALQLDFAANGTLANVLSGSGTLTKTGSGTATLTGAGSTQGAVTVSGGTLAFGQSGAFNAASLTTATGAGTQVAATSNLMLSGALTQAAGSTLTVAKGTQPAVTAQTANLNGTLSLSGYGTAAPASASGIAGTQYTVIHTTNGITGDFSSVNLNGAASTVDYLRLAGRVSGNDYNVGYGLSWLEGQAYGTGSFTLANASDAFNVDVALGDQAAGTYTSGWDGKTLTKAGAGTLTLSSVNTYTGDTLVNGGTLKAGIANAFAQSANVTVASGATLDLNNFNQTAHNLSGAGNVTLGSAMLTENAVSDTTFSGTLSGTGGLTKTGSGVFTLSGNNTYSGGTTVSAGTLQLGDGGTSGAITGDVTNNGTLAFNRSDATTFAGVISGSGRVTQVGTGKTIFTGTHTYSGGTTVSAGTLQLGNGGTTGSVQGAINIASGATLAVDWGADYTVNNTLTGSGLVAIKAAGNDVNFASAAMGAGFNGIVDLQNAAFSLGGVNTGALAAATLRLGSGSVTTVADGTQSIGGLAFDGGKAIFNATVPAQIDATSLVRANLLDASGAGVVQATLPVPYVLPMPVPSTELSLLEQDDVNLGTRLVAASTAVGSAGALELQDQNGNVISAAQQIDVQQGGNLVALGTYDYRLTTGTLQDGLYVSYGLKQLDLQAGQTLTLAQNSGATGLSADMSAKLTGSGNLRVDAGTGVLSLSNTTNNFTGNTTVATGTLQAGARDVIATSANVTVNAGATLDTHGYHQSLTNLTGAGTVTNGTTTATTLTLNDTVTSVFAGTLTGAQLALVQASGTQILTGSNTYGGGTAINPAATLQLGNGGTTGFITGNVTNNGTLTFNRSDTATFSGVISGTGMVNQMGTGRTILTGANSYSGGTTISAGTLQLGNGGTSGSLTGNVTNNGTLAFNRSDTLTLAGVISGSGVVNQIGTGKTILSGTNTYSGGTTISAGTLVAQNGAALGTGAVVNNAALQLDFAANGTLANVLSGNGTLTKTGTGTTTLTGAGSTQGAVTVSGGTLAFGQSGAFNAASLTTAAGAATQVAATSNLMLSGALTQAAGSTLTVAKGTQPAVTAQTANLNGTLSLSGYGTAAPASASGIAGTQYTVIHTTNGITGDFSSVNLNGAASTVDYLRLAGRVSGNDYNVGYGLSWLEGQAYGTGSFTLANASDAFNVDVALGDQAAGTYASGWDGKTLTKAGAGTLTLSSVNTYTGDTLVNGGTLKAGIASAFAQSANVAVASGATLDLNNFNQTARNLSGAGNVTLGSAMLTENAVSDTTFSGTLSGTGGLTKTGSGVFTLNGSNTYSGGTTVSAGTLQLGDGGTSGAITGNVTNNGTLAFNRSDVTTFDGVISGSGRVTQVGTGTTLFTGAHTYSGGTTVSAGTLQLGNGGTTGSVQGAIDIASGGTLAVDWGADYTVNNTLTGSGLVAIKAAGNDVNFASAAMGAGFSGVVDLQNAAFSLGGANTGALAAATLRLGSGSVTTVADGTQSIGSLVFNSGKAIFNATVPAQVDATSLVQANLLDTSGTGTVQVTLPTPYVLPTPAPSTDLSLLEQDDVNLGTRLVAASTAVGSAGALELQDQNGNAITAAQQINIQQGGNLVALGTYDYRLSSGANQDGLYVSYGLKQLDLQAAQTLTLAQNSGATGASADMSAKITGSGSLQVDAGTGIVSLSNTTNDFTGDTTVATGTLQAGALDVIATSANVTVNAGATLDTNGYDQSLTNLSGDGTVTNGTATDTILTLNDTATSVFAGDITGAQLALVQASGTQGLAGSNTYGGGTTINTGATLQLGNGGTRGSIAGNVTNDGTLAFNRSNTATFNGVISGTGMVDQTGTGRTILTGTNSYSGGSTISAGTLQLNDSQAAGTGAISVNTTAGDVGTGLDLAFSDASDFSNLLIGEGTTTVSGAQATITGANAGYTGNWRVTDTGTLAVATDAVSSTDNLGTGGVDIAADGIVNLLTQGAFSFNNALTGAGTLNASGHGQAFSFGSGVGSAFTGMAVLTDNTFALSGDNTTALTHGKLSVGTGNVTTVGDGNQQIGGLIINDGTVVFNATAPDEILATSLITADTLDISHTGTVYINAPESYVPHARDTDNSLNLLMQDEGNTGVQLVKSTSVTGSGGAIQLLNKDGSKITAERTIDINQNGDVVARGTYDYRLTSGANADGLYVNYGLTELDLQADKTLTLAQDTGAINASADMSAKVTGSGNLAIEAGAGVVSLSNATNDYTGETKVSTGTLRSDADNALGKTSLLSLANTAGFDLNGKTQTVGKLNGDAGSLLNVNGGTLALSNGGVSAGTLTGAGKLSVLGGTFDVRGANTGLSVVSQISKGATASLNNVAGLGSGNIITDGTLALNGAVGTMTNNISGTGELVKQGAGEVVLTGQTGWTGDTHIDGGELVLDGSRGGAQLVSNVIAKDNTSLSLRNGASLTGWIDPTDVSIDSASRWNMTADSLVDDVKLAGTINFAAPSTQSMTTGRTLTATNWHGQDGTVVMNTALGGDTSVTDKIVISGNTSGNTFVKVNNVGGRGAQTIEGIQVVKVGGQSDGTFTKSGRIVAGIYDYSLVKKGADWYLTSLDTSTKDKKSTSGIRPDPASYTANLAAANTMFVHRLHDREGETQYTDALTGEQKVTSMWLRQVGGHNRWSSSIGQVDTQSNRYVTQLGGEVAQWSPDGVQRLHVGVMAGYGRNSSNSRSNATGYGSDGSVNGYSTGLYATWYQNDETKQGMYVDSWAQYGWFDNTVKGEKVQSESYKSKGITASLELGYTHKLGDFTGSQGTESEWFIQPQAQAVWMGVTADDHYESNGTRVTGEGDGNVQTRLGVRTFLKSHNKLDEGKNRNFKPYVEINWIHNTQSFGSHMGDATLSQDGARNVGEVKAGVEGQLNSRLSVWGNVGVQVGDKGYSDTSATLGVKYNF